MAAILLVAGTVAAFLLSGCGPVPAQGPQRSPLSTSSPAISPGPTAPASPAVAASPTILASPIPMPTTAEFDAQATGVVWAFVGGLELFRSTDRAATWEQRPLPAGVVPWEMTFADDRNGWLLSAGSQAAQCPFEVATIWHTTDAGTTWVRLDARGIAASECRSLTFVDPVHGFLSASDASRAPVVYRTADGGLTWTPSRPLPGPPGSTTPAGRLPGLVRAFGSTLLVPSGRYVFRSVDGGATWSYLASMPPSSTSIAFVTAARWLELIAPGQSQETLDAGATWHPYASDYSQAAPVAPDVVFADPQVGYATVRGGLQRTLDGGLHWSPLHTPGT